MLEQLITTLKLTGVVEHVIDPHHSRGLGACGLWATSQWIRRTLHLVDNSTSFLPFLVNLPYLTKHFNYMCSIFTNLILSYNYLRDTHALV